MQRGKMKGKDRKIRKLVKGRKEKMMKRFGDHDIVQKTASLHIEHNKKEIVEDFGIESIDEIETQLYNLSQSSIRLVIRVVEHHLGKFGASLVVKGLEEYCEQVIDEMVEKEVLAALESEEGESDSRQNGEAEEDEKELTDAILRAVARKRAESESSVMYV